MPKQDGSVVQLCRWMGRGALAALSVLFVVLGMTTLPASPPHETPYWRWLQEEVPYIVTDQERVAFKKLTTDDERESFIETFWERRNPNPSSPENEFKEEYYRRIAYANEHYASGIPWLEDGSRPDLHHVRPAGRNRFPPQRRVVRAPGIRRRRADFHLSLSSIGGIDTLTASVPTSFWSLSIPP